MESGSGDSRAGGLPQESGGLRDAFSGLTTRGRSFLAAGAAAAACAYVLGQSDLLRVGLLLMCLPVVCTLVLFRTRHQVRGTRWLAPARVPAAGEAKVHLQVENVSRLPTRLLMLQDRVPYVLGPRPRFVLDRVEPGGKREVSYRVRSDLRGAYALGPLQLRLTDPFGMCELIRSFPAHDTLTVVPQVTPLPPTALLGQARGHGEGRLQAPALLGEDDVIPRGYRHGDDIRRVHWRSTARHGELMVRREEQPQQSRCTVLLDTRGSAYYGSGPGSAFEWAVSGAASVLLHMLERGLDVGLVTDDGLCVPRAGTPRGNGPGASELSALLLDTLAVIDHSETYELSGFTRMPAGGGLMVGFFGDLDETEAAQLATIRRAGRPAVAFLLDSGPWSGDPTGPGSPAPGTQERALRVLREAGWTAVPVQPGAGTADMWRFVDGHPDTTANGRQRVAAADARQGTAADARQGTAAGAKGHG